MPHLNDGERRPSIAMGSLVRIKHIAPNPAPGLESPSLADRVGIVTDILEMADGFYQYEVVYSSDRGWFDNLQLDVIDDESR
jgi:hypothetical protein